MMMQPMPTMGHQMMMQPMPTMGHQMMMQQTPMMGQMSMGSAGTHVTQTSPFLHNLTNTVMQTQQTQKTATQDLQRAASLDRAALLDTSLALSPNATPLQRAVLLNQAALSGRLAQLDRTRALLAGASPLQKATVHDRMALVDRAVLDGAALRDGFARLGQFAPYNPAANFNPYSPLTSTLGNGSGLFANNPFSPASGSTGSGYAGGSSTGSGYGGGSGGGSATSQPTSGGYGSSSGGYGSSSPQSYPYAIPASTAVQDASSPLINALGLPVAGGRMSWPLGLRVLTPATKAEALRRQLDGIIQLAASSNNGQLTPGAFELATDAAAQLRSMLRQKQGSAAMAESTYRDATDFLDRLEVALLALKR